jgi:hypothetical protein
MYETVGIADGIDWNCSVEYATASFDDPASGCHEILTAERFTRSDDGSLQV